MGIIIIYFLIIIFANALGAVSGMGGGVLIKPIFDMMGFHSLSAISFYSSVAVFTMAITSTIRQLQNGVKIKFGFALSISLGAVFGGIVGNIVFEKLLELLQSESLVQIIQIVLTIISLIFVLIYTKEDMKTFKLENKIWYVIVGLGLGFLATLLGIGGGPINVTMLMLCFSIEIKEATVYSIITILFSQLAKLVTMGATSGFTSFDLTILLSIIPAAICGGFIGGKLSGVLSEDKVMKIYKSVVILVICINVYNGIQLVL